jgi:hypothetical protein
LAKALASFPSVSGGGPDGLRPQHLKYLTSTKTGATGAELLEALTDFTNHQLAGLVPNEILPILYGATLIALNKKGGGIRPIAIGCTLRRLAAKLACRPITEALGPLLCPHQSFFATPCGTEAIVHSFRRQIASGTSGLILKFQECF